MPPKTAYLLFDDQPANTTPYTLIEVIASIKSTATFKPGAMAK